MPIVSAADSALGRLVALEVVGLVLLPDGGPRPYHRHAGDASSRGASVQGTLVVVDDAIVG